MLKHFVLAMLLGFILFFAYLAWHVGYFKPVTIENVGPKKFVLLGVPHDGAYHKIVSRIETVEKWAKGQKIDCTQSFGLYLDDPKQVEQDRLKSFGGCLITPEGQLILSQINLQDHQKKDFFLQIKNWDSNEFIYAEFKGSPGIGPYKVYPEVEKYLTRNKQALLGQGVLEVYTQIKEKAQNPSSEPGADAGQGMTSEYYFPVQAPAPEFR